jgi:hypothetical protein
MTPQTAQNIMTLLQRAQISGAEVPIYMQCMHDLSFIVDGANIQTKFDASIDAKNMLSGATKNPDEFVGD